MCRNWANRRAHLTSTGAAAGADGWDEGNLAGIIASAGASELERGSSRGLILLEPPEGWRTGSARPTPTRDIGADGAPFHKGGVMGDGW